MQQMLQRSTNKIQCNKLYSYRYIIRWNSNQFRVYLPVVSIYQSLIFGWKSLAPVVMESRLMRKEKYKITQTWHGQRFTGFGLYASLFQFSVSLENHVFFPILSHSLTFWPNGTLLDLCHSCLKPRFVLCLGEYIHILHTFNNSCAPWDVQVIFFFADDQI